MITQKDLLTALRAVGKLRAGSKRLYSDNGLLALSAYNGNYLTYTTDAPYNGPQLEFDLKRLTAIVRAFPPTADLTLTWLAPSLTISCGPVAVPVDAWLSESYVLDWKEAEVEIPVSVFRQALATAIPSAAVDEGRWSLHAIHFVLTADRLRVEAADGFRLIRHDFPGEYPSADFLIGLGEAKALRAILNGSSPVGLSLERNSDGIPFKMHISQGRFRLTTNLPAVRYIDVDVNLFARAGTATFPAKRDDLLLVARLTLALKEKLLLTSNDGQLHFDTHVGKVRLMSIPYSGSARSGIDPVYLRDAVTPMGDDVLLYIPDTVRPIRITSGNLDALVMPININL